MALRPHFFFPAGVFLSRDCGEAAVLCGGSPDLQDGRGSLDVRRVRGPAHPSGTAEGTFKCLNSLGFGFLLACLSAGGFEILSNDVCGHFVWRV